MKPLWRVLFDGNSIRHAGAGEKALVESWRCGTALIGTAGLDQTWLLTIHPGLGEWQSAYIEEQVQNSALKMIVDVPPQEGNKNDASLKS